MRKKCKWCGKVKSITYHDSISGDFFCSRDCMRKATNLLFLVDIACARCGSPIRMNGVVQKQYTTNSCFFYCCEKCAMEDIGIVKDAEEEI